MARLTDDVHRALPNEACGLLAGLVRGNSLFVDVYPAANELRSRTAFLIGAGQAAQLESRIAADGLTLVGCYHSHPFGADSPSPADRMLATRPFFWWVICAPRRSSVRAYWWSGSRFVRRPLRIVPRRRRARRDTPAAA